MSSRIHLRRNDADPRDWIGVVEDNGSVKITEGRVGKAGRSKVIGPNLFGEGRDARSELLFRARAKMLEGFESLSWQVEDAPSNTGPTDPGSVIFFTARELTTGQAGLAKVLKDLVANEANALGVRVILDDPLCAEITLGEIVVYNGREPGSQLKGIAPRASRLSTQFLGLLARASNRLGIEVKAADDDGNSVDPLELFKPGQMLEPDLLELAYASGVVPRPMRLNTTHTGGQPFQAAVF